MDKKRADYPSAFRIPPSAFSLLPSLQAPSAGKTSHLGSKRNWLRESVAFDRWREDKHEVSIYIEQK
jgi:hypothetical protein